jgi:non-specific protein-tyrosine kinase
MNTLMAGERLALTYVQLLKGRSTLESAISRMGLTLTPEGLAKRIEAAPVKDTQLVRVTATDTSPARAALIANTVAEVFTDYAKTLEQDRYQSELLAKQAKIEAQGKTIEETLSQINVANQKKASDKTELARVQTLLDEYRSTNRALQQEHDSVQQLLTRAMNTVNIVESPRVQPAGATGLYTASVTLLIDQAGTNAEAGVASTPAQDRITETYARMLTGQSVLEAAIAKQGVEQSVDDLAKAVEAEQIPGTQLVRLQVNDADAEQASLMATAIAQAFIDQMNEILRTPYSGRLTNIQDEMASVSALVDKTQAEVQVRAAASLLSESEFARLEDMLAEYRTDYRRLQQDYEQERLTASQAQANVVITERAHEPRAPSGNNQVYVLLAVVVAGLVASGAAFLIEYLEESVQTPEDVSRVLSLGTLGMIEQFGLDQEKSVGTSPLWSQAGEAFHMLAASIRLSSIDMSLRTILVTSPDPGDGKSLVAANLATAMARAGLRVVLVDADLRRPRQHELFGLDQRQGLTYALWQSSIKDHLKPSAIEGVAVLTSGTLPPDPIGVLSSPRLAKLLDELAQLADIIIIDSPPVLPVADARILAAVSDSALLVLRAGQSGSQPARRAVEALRQTKTHLLGVVLNGVRTRNDSYYRYYGAKGETAVATPGPRTRLRRFPWQPPARSGENTR